MYRHPPDLDRGPRAGGVGSDRAAAGRPELVLVLQRRRDQHPEHPRLRRRGAVRHRLLLGEPVANAVRRRADARPGGAPARCGDRRRRADERDPRVRPGPCDVHLRDPLGGRPAGRRLRNEGRISVGIPFNIPPDRPTRVSVFAGGEPPVAPGVEVLEFETADPYGAEAQAFAAAILDDQPTPVPPADAVANMRVIERIFAAAEGG